MPDLRCYCAVCGKGIDLAADFTGRLVECPGCRRTVPVPALAPGGSAETMAVYPREILSVEIRFLCGECGAKLMIDARWQGSALDCPKCRKHTRVPQWCTSPAPASGARLSEAEIEFLSGSTEAAARAC